MTSKVDHIAVGRAAEAWPRGTMLRAWANVALAGAQKDLPTGTRVLINKREGFCPSIRTPGIGFRYADSRFGVVVMLSLGLMAGSLTSAS